MRIRKISNFVLLIIKFWNKLPMTAQKVSLSCSLRVQWKPVNAIKALVISQFMNSQIPLNIQQLTKIIVCYRIQVRTGARYVYTKWRISVRLECRVFTDLTWYTIQNMWAIVRVLVMMRGHTFLIQLKGSRVLSRCCVFVCKPGMLVVRHT